MAKTNYTELTERQAEFVRLFSGGLMSAKDAYVAAGYKDTPSSAKSASKMLKNHLVKEELDRLRRLADDKCIADIVECKKALTKIIRDKDASNKDRISSVGQMAKISAWESTEVNLNVKSDPDNMTDEELARIAQGG